MLPIFMLQILQSDLVIRVNQDPMGQAALPLSPIDGIKVGLNFGFNNDRNSFNCGDS